MNLNLLQSKTNSGSLFADVPIHQLLEKPLEAMTPAELDAFIEHTATIIHSPATRRATTKKEAKAIKKGDKHETNQDRLSHLF